MNYTDEQIVKQIQSNDNSKVLKHLYHMLYKPVRKIVKSGGGNNEDIKDILQKGIVIFWENVVWNKYNKEENTKLTTYILSICKYQWLNYKKRYKPDISLELTENDSLLKSENDEDEDYKETRNKKVQEAIKALNKSCRQIITLYYLNNMSMKEIAVELEFSSERSAITQKYKCLKKLIALVKTN